MTRWVLVLRVDELVDGRGCVTVGDHKVALFLRDGEVFALGDTCTHLDASLSEGKVWRGRVICPWHGVQFDLRTGAASGPPARGDVRTYPCRVEDGEVWVALGPARE